MELQEVEEGKKGCSEVKQEESCTWNLTTTQHTIILLPKTRHWRRSQPHNWYTSLSSLELVMWRNVDNGWNKNSHSNRMVKDTAKYKVTKIVAAKKLEEDRSRSLPAKTKSIEII